MTSLPFLTDSPCLLSFFNGCLLLFSFLPHISLKNLNCFTFNKITPQFDYITKASLKAEISFPVYNGGPLKHLITPSTNPNGTCVISA